MERTEREIRARAQRVYELGRLRFALKVLVYVVPMVLLAAWSNATPTAWNVAIGVALGVLTVGLLWRGEAHGRAVSTGLVSGAIPLLVPLIMQATGHCCIAGACSTLCLPLCTGAGIAAGIMVGMRAASERQAPGRFALSAIGVAALTGALGCTGMGLAAVAGMVAALALVSAPIAVVGMRLRRP
ncbi:MAG: hypothetical protein IPM54_00090 [Polyangiaceae bacterium]|nr:hypothetical protein [Polyangiaceae bacterium]